MELKIYVIRIKINNLKKENKFCQEPKEKYNYIILYLVSY